MATKKRTDALDGVSSKKSSKLEYLHKIGLTDLGESDLQAPELSKFGTNAHDDFALIGKDVHPEFEYWRATNGTDIERARSEGWIPLPKTADVRYKGCHTESEIMMTRTKEQGEVYRKAQAEKLANLRSGRKQSQTPMGGGVALDETFERSPVSMRVRD